VGNTYQELLNDSEMRWFQALYVRLSNRQSDVFRLGKLKYPEIDSLPDATNDLCKIGLAYSDAPDNVEELIPAFTKPELIKLLQLQDHRQLSRPELEEHIIERDSAHDIELLQKADQWITVDGLDEYAVFKLCFFGNGYQDMSEFVLRDLGVFQYEQYRIDSHSRVFQSREQLDAHLQYLDSAYEYSDIDQSDVQALLEISTSLPENQNHDPHLSRRVDRMRNSIARQLERLDEPDQALAMYEKTTHAPSRERQVRVLMKLERFKEAHALCTTIVDAPLVEEELQFVETITPKLYKQLQLTPPKRQVFKPNTTKLNLTQSNQRVEFIAREFYQQFGECFYVENRLINGVLGLFIWDIIFAPVDGVFFNPFQSAPADFYQSSFVEKRADLLEKRFKELDDPLLFSARVWQCYESRQGIMNRLVNWGYLSESLLSTALIRIPVSDWRALFNRILLDLRNHTSGLPDLILFPKNGSYELIEIKGPGDAVQKNQRRWMAYFSEHRIPYRVVHVRWSTQSLQA